MKQLRLRSSLERPTRGEVNRLIHASTAYQLVTMHDTNSRPHYMIPDEFHPSAHWYRTSVSVQSQYIFTFGVVTLILSHPDLSRGCIETNGAARSDNLLPYKREEQLPLVGLLFTSLSLQSSL